MGLLALGALLWPRVGPSMRVPLIAGGAALIFVVGLSRVVLNVHHPSDAVAGWAPGLLYYLLCVRCRRRALRGFRALRRDLRRRCRSYRRARRPGG